MGISSLTFIRLYKCPCIKNILLNEWKKRYRMWFEWRIDFSLRSYCKSFTRFCSSQRFSNRFNVFKIWIWWIHLLLTQTSAEDLENSQDYWMHVEKMSFKIYSNWILILMIPDEPKFSTEHIWIHDHSVTKLTRKNGKSVWICQARREHLRS